MENNIYSTDCAICLQTTLENHKPESLNLNNHKNSNSPQRTITQLRPLKNYNNIFITIIDIIYKIKYLNRRCNKR